MSPRATTLAAGPRQALPPLPKSLWQACVTFIITKENKIPPNPEKHQGQRNPNKQTENPNKVKTYPLQTKN